MRAARRVHSSRQGPACFAPDDGALEVLARLLTETESSRLHRRLVRELEVAQSVSAYPTHTQLGSRFEIVATARPGRTPDELVAAIDAELVRLQREPPARDEVERAVTGRVSQQVFDMERLDWRADWLNTYNHYAGDPDYLARDLGRYRACTPESLRRAASEYLPLARRLAVRIYPDPAAPPAGRLRAAPLSAEAPRPRRASRVGAAPGPSARWARSSSPAAGTSRPP